MDANFYNFTQQLQGQLFYAMYLSQPDIVAQLPQRPPMLQIRAGYAESPAWFMIQAAEFDPEPLTITNLRVRDIYAAPRIVQALLELLAGEGWLRHQADTYYLTDTGREQLTQLQARGQQLLKPTTPPLPTAQIERLESLLNQIITASLATEHTWCLAHSRHRAPAAAAPPLLKISQYCSDLNAFRDDAHMAAWQPEKVSGHTWEAFALVATQQADSAATVFEQLRHRGYTQAEYADTLHGLVERGWLTPNTNTPEQYELTDNGRSVHARVEARTDEHFYAPWQTLSAAERAEMEQLLQQLQEALQSLIDTHSSSA